MIYIDDLLGTPFKIHGRDKLGYDCYGLVIEVLNRYGFSLIDLYESYTKENYLDLMAKDAYTVVVKSKLTKIEQPTESDILLFFDEQGRTTHVGVYLGKDKFIHCDGRGVNVTKLSNYFRTWEAYKWHK